MKKRLHTGGMAQARVMLGIPELDAWATGDVTARRKKIRCHNLSQRQRLLRQMSNNRRMSRGF
ncbi:hypothetical protein OKW38_004528 [Paraburkholderia sp. MM5496-R1]|uniref:hypothetical protein n=1 Tax=unclassified Paraburkholderia TaxID=2615204 RepID=UPI00160CF22F|nr:MULTISPECIES: hypothetical protein [unclassified Paraburkholderia]MBB5407127.1 hypothetical protein [Paraburkholderia sp. HC6.4b]MBB5449524.1 hypothetical protein [Paraburkholderia sp. Kb1A]